MTRYFGIIILIIFVASDVYSGENQNKIDHVDSVCIENQFYNFKINECELCNNYIDRCESCSIISYSNFIPNSKELELECKSCSKEYYLDIEKMICLSCKSKFGRRCSSCNSVICTNYTHERSKFKSNEKNDSSNSRVLEVEADQLDTVADFTDEPTTGIIERNHDRCDERFERGNDCCPQRYYLSMKESVCRSCQSYHFYCDSCNYENCFHCSHKDKSHNGKYCREGKLNIAAIIVPILLIILLAITSIFIYKYIKNKKIQRTITPTDVNIIENNQNENPNVEIADIKNNNPIIISDLKSKDKLNDVWNNKKEKDIENLYLNDEDIISRKTSKSSNNKLLSSDNNSIRSKQSNKESENNNPPVPFVNNFSSS